MKPVGLVDPRSGTRPHAVVQLRQEDKRGILLGLVGFQTRLRQADQKRVFRMLPGLSEAAFARFGSVHRNTYVNAPRHLNVDLSLRAAPGVYLAGQMAGVEGYVESAALGLLAGIHVAHAVRGEAPPLPDEATAHGALLHYLVGADAKRFQPMNVNYGLFPPLEGAPRRATRREKNERLAERALARIDAYASRVRAQAG
jgi:methylenetetrahydrofolate--tRNA-(uracil-5-)-methyltransferase